MRKLKKLFREARLNLSAYLWFALFYALSEYKLTGSASLPNSQIWGPLADRAYVRGHLALLRAAGI